MVENVHSSLKSCWIVVTLLFSFFFIGSTVQLPISHAEKPRDLLLVTPSQTLSLCSLAECDLSSSVSGPLYSPRRIILVFSPLCCPHSTLSLSTDPLPAPETRQKPSFPLLSIEKLVFFFFSKTHVDLHGPAQHTHKDLYLSPSELLCTLSVSHLLNKTDCIIVE